MLSETQHGNVELRTAGLEALTSWVEQDPKIISTINTTDFIQTAHITITLPLTSVEEEEEEKDILAEIAERHALLKLLDVISSEGETHNPQELLQAAETAAIQAEEEGNKAHGQTGGRRKANEWRKVEEAAEILQWRLEYEIDNGGKEEEEEEGEGEEGEGEAEKKKEEEIKKMKPRKKMRHGGIKRIRDKRITGTVEGEGEEEGFIHTTAHNKANEELMKKMEETEKRLEEANKNLSEAKTAQEIAEGKAVNAEVRANTVEEKMKEMEEEHNKKLQEMEEEKKKIEEDVKNKEKQAEEEKKSMSEQLQKVEEEKKTVEKNLAELKAKLTRLEGELPVTSLSSFTLHFSAPNRLNVNGNHIIHSGADGWESVIFTKILSRVCYSCCLCFLLCLLCL